MHIDIYMFLIYVQSVYIKTAVNLVPHKNCSEFSSSYIYLFLWVYICIYVD